MSDRIASVAIFWTILGLSLFFMFREIVARPLALVSGAF